MRAPLKKGWKSLDRGQRCLLILCLLVSLLAIIQGMHRARKGRNALLKWGPVFESVERGEPIYGVGEEGYPTLPVTLMMMAPFHSMGPLPGAFFWALARIVLAWWIVWMCFRLGAGRARDVPWQAQALVLLLCLRILHSEIQHANINLPVAACVVAAACAWRGGREHRGGVWMGLGAGLKVTPALGLLLFARQKSLRGLAGMGSGLLMALLLPILWLGPSRTYSMTLAWIDQMLLPYLSGRDLGLRQTEHINQSLLGLMGRLCTDSVAIPSGKVWPSQDVSVNIWSLSQESFRSLHMGLALALCAFVFWACAKRPAHGQAAGLRALGLFGLISLAMLLLSERSWKHHHVVFPLAATYLALFQPASPRPTSRMLTKGARIALILAILLVLGSGEGILGKRGADWAEAYGAFTWATLVLFVACGLCLRDSKRGEDKVSSEGFAK